MFDHFVTTSKIKWSINDKTIKAAAEKQQQQKLQMISLT